MGPAVGTGGKGIGEALGTSEAEDCGEENAGDPAGVVTGAADMLVAGVAAGVLPEVPEAALTFSMAASELMRTYAASAPSVTDGVDHD